MLLRPSGGYNKISGRCTRVAARFTSVEPKLDWLRVIAVPEAVREPFTANIWVSYRPRLEAASIQPFIFPMSGILHINAETDM